MQINLEEKDLKRLSEAARNEILSIVGWGKDGVNGGAEEGAERALLFDLEEHMLAEFMNKLPPKSEQFIQVFSEHDGVGSSDLLLEVTGGDSLGSLSGIINGLNKRVRKLNSEKNSKVAFTVWDWNDNWNGDWDGNYMISKTTTKSLVKYFKTRLKK